MGWQTLNANANPAAAPGGPNTDTANGPGASLGLTAAELELLRNLIKCMVSPDSDDEVVVQGCDFIVRSNGGATIVDLVNDRPEGKGNLVVGWNEVYGWNPEKTGLNNLVVGANHSYTSTGGAVFGERNIISGSSAVVSGGHSNKASGESASVIDGMFLLEHLQHAKLNGTRLEAGTNCVSGFKLQNLESIVFNSTPGLQLSSQFCDLFDQNLDSIVFYDETHTERPFGLYDAEECLTHLQPCEPSS